MELLLSMTFSFSFAALGKCKPVKLKMASYELEGLCMAFHPAIHPSCRPSNPPFVYLSIHQIIRPPINKSIFDYDFLFYVYT